MGMSGDLEAAIAEGATIVRVGHGALRAPPACAAGVSGGQAFHRIPSRGR